AQFDGPIGVALDRKGNIFVADTYNDSVRTIATDGNVRTIAGVGFPGFDDGDPASASFDTPCGIALDKRGNVFIADTGNHAIRKIAPDGNVSTVARRTDGVPEENLPRLNHPVGVVATHDGFLFISDEGGGRIVRVTPEGVGSVYAGQAEGFADGAAEGRFNGPSGIALDREGNLYVADSQNYLIREVRPVAPQPVAAAAEVRFIQPSMEPPASRRVFPAIEKSALGVGETFPWPLVPQDQWHEVAGVVGEARGAPGGIALDHIHSGLDIHGGAGVPVLSVYDEKAGSPIANWDFDGAGEGISVGLFGYIHIRVGRNESDEIQAAEKFKPRTDATGKLIGVRVRRGTRFKVGEFIGSVNRLNHVHLNLGPWNAQANPLQLPFFGFKDTVAPVIEPNGIEVVPAAALASDVREQDGKHFREKRNGRLVVFGDVAVLVTAFDRAEGNGANRKLGVYRLGYQVLNEDGSSAKGFEQPLVNIEFNRLPPEDSSVFKVYASGSGVSAYGTPTKFRYIVTNRVRDGEAMNGILRTSSLPSGNYIIKVIAEDYAGNRALGTSTELAITVVN
ncbi:MAG TPA: gluconolaconase, partial [Blastocatellia bacterium]|nr:gluconolaconase [Blastocatellia bacterium]